MNAFTSTAAISTAKTRTADVTIINGPDKGEPIEVMYEDPVDREGMDPGEIAWLSFQAYNGAGLITLGVVAAIAGETSTGQTLIKLGAKQLGKAVAKGVKNLVQRIRADNSTTVVLVNGHPNMRLRLDEVELEDGKLVDGYSKSSLEDVTAKAPSGDAYQAIMFATKDKTKGTARCTLFIEDNGKTIRHQVELHFYNSRGPKQEKSKYSWHAHPLSLLDHENVLAKRAVLEDVGIDHELEMADGSSRRDVAVFHFGLPDE